MFLNICWWSESHTYISLTMQWYMTFPPPHQQIFIETSIFADFFLTVQCCWKHFPLKPWLHRITQNLSLLKDSQVGVQTPILAGPGLLSYKENRSFPTNSILAIFDRKCLPQNRFSNLWLVRLKVLIKPQVTRSIGLVLQTHDGSLCKRCRLDSLKCRLNSLNCRLVFLNFRLVSLKCRLVSLNCRLVSPSLNCFWLCPILKHTVQYMNSTGMYSEYCLGFLLLNYTVKG